MVDLKTATETLQKIHADQSAVENLTLLVQYLRTKDVVEIKKRWTLLLTAMRANPTQTQIIGIQAHQWLNTLQVYPALVQLGIFSRLGMVREMINRLYDRLNPPPLYEHSSTDQLACMLSRQDKVWIEAITASQWLSLYQILRQATPTEILQTTSDHLECEFLYALEMLAIWVAAEELDPELIRIDHRLTDIDSPFIALQREVHAYVAQHSNTTANVSAPAYDMAHLWVMLDQSKAQVDRFRRRGAADLGSSLNASHLIERLEQTLQRIEQLAYILNHEHKAASIKNGVQLWQDLLQATTEKSSIKEVWKKSTRILSRTITQNKSDHGEHYISRDWKSYFGLIASAAGAGIMIALMALLKLHIEDQGLAPLTQTILVSLNYGIGFVIIHLLHFTIATKQPAMTAASFAAEVEHHRKGRASGRLLAKLLVDVNRSQWAAVWGNVTTALLTAFIVTYVVLSLSGQALLSPTQVSYQLQAISPFESLALLYAAIAGVWLFCAGIIAGFFDNRADHLQLRQRLLHHPALSKLPSRVREKFAHYLHDNYGALAGNFIFGVLLGVTGYIGYLLGLPLDIRHVAFSSANLGYASFSEFAGWLYFLVGLVFVLMIGFVNLWVSFTLALWVALRSRGCKIEIKTLLVGVKDEFLQNPLRFFLPYIPHANRTNP